MGISASLIGRMGIRGRYSPGPRATFMLVFEVAFEIMSLLDSIRHVRGDGIITRSADPGRITRTPQLRPTLGWNPTSSSDGARVSRTYFQRVHEWVRVRNNKSNPQIHNYSANVRYAVYQIWSVHDWMMCKDVHAWHMILWLRMVGTQALESQDWG